LSFPCSFGWARPPVFPVHKAMDLVPTSAKKRIQILLDIHQIDPETRLDSYEHFDLTLTKRE
jgi:hypothetical protein